MAVLPLLLLLLLHISVSHGHLLPPNETLPHGTAVRQFITADSLIFELEDVADSDVPLVVPDPDLGRRPSFGRPGADFGDQGQSQSRSTADALLAGRAADSLRECLVDLDQLMDRDKQQGRRLSRQLRRVLRSTSRLIEFTLERFDQLRRQRTEGRGGGRGGNTLAVI